MPQPTSTNVPRSHRGIHPDRAAARVARTLSLRVGYLAALMKVSARHARYAAVYEHVPSAEGAWRCTYWRTVLGVLRRSAPAALQAETLLTDVERAVANGYAA